MADNRISSSLEDYLEVIAEIIENNGHAHAKDIAEKLAVKMPSVTNALQSLAARGLVNYSSHLPVEMTTRGSEAAAVIRHRHSALKSFFSEILKIDDFEANGTACRIEHVISDTVLSRIVVLADAVRSRKDCAQLREYLTDAMPKVSAEGDDLAVIALDKLPRHVSGVVVSVDENLRGVRKFADLGLVSGTLLRVEGRAPFGDLLRIKVMGSSLSIRSSDAMHIWVRPVE